MLIHYKKTNILNTGKLTLKPGINEVSEEHWNDAMQKGVEGKPLYPDFHELKDDGVIVEVTGGKQKDKAAEASDFHDMPEKQAMKLAASTADYDLLKSWADKEKRKPVLAVLKSQMKKFEDA